MGTFRGLLKETQTQLVIEGIFFPGIHVDTLGGGHVPMLPSIQWEGAPPLAILLM